MDKVQQEATHRASEDLSKGIGPALESNLEGRCYCWNGFELNEQAETLRYHGVEVALEPLGMQLLLYLLRNRHRIVEQKELRRLLWPDVVVSQGALTQCVYSVRRALRSVSPGDMSLETVRTRGYRLRGKVRDTAAEPHPSTRVQATAEFALHQLHELLRRAMRGEGGVALVWGTRSAGRQALLHWMVDQARADGLVTFHHEARTLHRRPLVQWLELLRQYAAQTDGAANPRLQRLLQDGCCLAGALPGDVGRAEHDWRVRVIDLIAELTRGQPALLVLDDLSAGSEIDRLLVERFGETTASSPLLILAGMPPGVVPDMPIATLDLCHIVLERDPNRELCQLQRGSLHAAEAALLVRSPEREHTLSALVDAMARASSYCTDARAVTRLVELITALEDAFQTALLMGGTPFQPPDCVRG